MYSDDVISVIAPAYNHEKYIIDSLSSIARQTYYNKELIVIDDCSSDKTADLIQNYINRETVYELFPAGIKFIRHERNVNAHNTINEGIRLATGRYISIINTDDCYEMNRLELLTDEIKRNEARLAFSKVRCIDENNEFIQNKEFEAMAERLCYYPSPSFSLVISNSAIGTGNFLFEKSLYEEVGGFSSKYHFIHDWDFILKTAQICEPVFVDKTNYVYRFHSTNTIKQISKNREMERKKDWEVQSVLCDFLRAILKSNCENPILKDIEMWDYFFDLFPTEYCSYLWKKLRKEEFYGI